MSTRRRPPTIAGRRQVPAGYALITGLITLALATLLNADSLLETAQRQPLGTTRSLAVGVMEPIAGFSDLVQFDLPRKLVDRALGRAGDTPAASDPGAGPDDPEPPTVLHPVDATSTTTQATTTTTAAPAAAVRTPSTADPMRLWIIGDSFMELLGPALQNDATSTGVVAAEVDFRFISGLVRPDYFDWPAHIIERMPEVRAESVVVMFGGNDGQPMMDGADELQPDTPAWLEAYGALVGEAMDTILDSGAARVYWIGLPIMRNDEFTERVIGFNQVYREQADARPRVTYISSFELFQDDNGEYSTFLRTDAGDLREMRSEDGAHFTWPGAYRLSEHVLEAIAADWDIDL